MTNLTNKLYKYILSLKWGSFNPRITDLQTTIIRLLMGFFIAASLVWGWSDLNPVFLDFYFQSGLVNCTGNRNPNRYEPVLSDYLVILDNYKESPASFPRWMQHQLMLHSPEVHNPFIMHIEMQGALHFIIKDRAGTLTQSDLQYIYKILTQYGFKHRECYMVGHDLLIKHVELLQTVAPVTPTPSHVELLQTVAQVTPIPNPIPLKVAEVTPIPNPNAGGWGYGYGQYVLGTVVLGIGIYLGWDFLKPLAQELCSAIGRS